MSRSLAIAGFAFLSLAFATACGAPPSSDESAASAEESAKKCHTKRANIDGDTLAEMPWADASQTYFYSFIGNGTLVNDSGTFTVTIEPPCLRSTPACKIAVRSLTGTFQTYGSTLELDYADGHTAWFDAKLDCANRWQLVGDDFGAQRTLVVTTLGFR
jgi:hypothetical protein